MAATRPQCQTTLEGPSAADPNGRSKRYSRLHGGAFSMPRIKGSEPAKALLTGEPAPLRPRRHIRVPFLVPCPVRFSLLLAAPAGAVHAAAAGSTGAKARTAAIANNRNGPAGSASGFGSCPEDKRHQDLRVFTVAMKALPFGPRANATVQTDRCHGVVGMPATASKCRRTGTASW